MSMGVPALLDLPDECLAHCLRFLSALDVTRLCRVCQRLRRIANDDFLWQCRCVDESLIDSHSVTLDSLGFPPDAPWKHVYWNLLVGGYIVDVETGLVISECAGRRVVQMQSRGTLTLCLSSDGDAFLLLHWSNQYRGGESAPVVVDLSLPGVKFVQMDACELNAYIVLLCADRRTLALFSLDSFSASLLRKDFLRTLDLAPPGAVQYPLRDLAAIHYGILVLDAACRLHFLYFRDRYDPFGSVQYEAVQTGAYPPDIVRLRSHQHYFALVTQRGTLHLARVAPQWICLEVLSSPAPSLLQAPADAADAAAAASAAAVGTGHGDGADDVGAPAAQMHDSPAAQRTGCATTSEALVAAASGIVAEDTDRRTPWIVDCICASSLSAYALSADGTLYRVSHMGVFSSAWFGPPVQHSCSTCAATDHLLAGLRCDGRVWIMHGDHHKIYDMPAPVVALATRKPSSALAAVALQRLPSSVRQQLAAVSIADLPGH